jgi:hypothetical protein
VGQQYSISDAEVFLDCETFLTHVWILAFWRNKLSPSSGLKMEALCFNKMFVSTYESTWKYNPEEQGWKGVLFGGH